MVIGDRNEWRQLQWARRVREVKLIKEIHSVWQLDLESKFVIKCTTYYLPVMLAMSTRDYITMNARRACRHMQQLLTVHVQAVHSKQHVKYGSSVKLHTATEQNYGNAVQCLRQFIAFYWKLEMGLIWLITGRAQNFNYDISVAVLVVHHRHRCSSAMIVECTTCCGLR